MLVAACTEVVPEPIATAEAADAAPVCHLFATGDARGYLEPCGCGCEQFGGLPRRATLLAAARGPGDLVIDLGNLAAGTSDLERIGWRRMIGALDELRYDALVPGGSEVAQIEEFRTLTAPLAHMRVICANLLVEADGSRVFEPWILRTLPTGEHLAIVGLTSETQRPAAGYRVEPVAESAARAVTELAGRAEVIVFAGWIEGLPALRLAAAAPHPALVLASRVPCPSPEPIRREGAPVMLAGDRGQHVADIEIGRHGEILAARLRWLGQEFPDDPAMKTRVAAWHEELKAGRDAAVREAEAALRAAQWAGSDACVTCHPAETAAWRGTGHAMAALTLAAKHEEPNPLCLACHVRDLPDVSRAEPARGVGCEACHGPGRQHAEARRGAAARSAARMPAVDAAACTRCHNAEHSRTFEFESYRARIAHGGAAGGLR